MVEFHKNSLDRIINVINELVYLRDWDEDEAYRVVYVYSGRGPRRSEQNRGGKLRGYFSRISSRWFIPYVRIYAFRCTYNMKTKLSIELESLTEYISLCIWSQLRTHPPLISYSKKYSGQPHQKSYSRARREKISMWSLILANIKLIR